MSPESDFKASLGSFTQLALVEMEVPRALGGSTGGLATLVGKCPVSDVIVRGSGVKRYCGTPGGGVPEWFLRGLWELYLPTSFSVLMQ